MRVDQVMTKEVKTCRTSDTLNVAAQIMWDGDLGCVPVVGEHGRVLGIVTDRDICMAAHTQNRPLSAIPVSIAMSKLVHTCGPSDSVEDAERIMQKYQVRRLPVRGAEAQLVGILSLSDLARTAGKGKKADGISIEAVEATLAAVCEPRKQRPAPPT